MAYEDNFKIFGPYFNKKNSRKIVIVIDRNGIKRTVSFPKWVMECHLGRPLDKDLETVDHWDSNKSNDSLENLRIMPRDEHSRSDTRRVKLIKCKCAWCGIDFERSPRLLREKAKKGSIGPFCQRSCAAKYSRMLQLKLIDKLDFPRQQPIESKYYKQKYVSASVNLGGKNFIDFFIDYFCDFEN